LKRYLNWQRVRAGRLPACAVDGLLAQLLTDGFGKWRQVSFDHTPDELRIDAQVTMREDVPVPILGFQSGTAC
jgi:hypothetical protein